MLKHLLLRLVFLANMLLFACVCTVPASIFASEATPQETEKKLANVQQQIRTSQQTLEQQRGELGGLEKQLREAELMIGNMNQQLIATETTIKNKQEKIFVLEEKQQKLHKQLAEHQSILYAQVRSEHQYGGQQKLKLLLNQQEPEKLGRDLVYYDYLHRARLGEMDKATKILQSVNEVQRSIRQAEEGAKQAKLNLLSEKQLLEQAQSKRKQAIGSLNDNVSYEKEKLAALEGNEKELKGLIEKLRAALADIPVIDKNKGFSKSQGKLYWPVVGKPKNKFGQKRSSSRSKLNWQGVFIPSPEGNNVRSIYHGRVAFAEWMRGLGLLIVDHGDGYMSLYGHNQSLFKQVGEWVDAGEKLATVGNSGGNSQAGLYFEIRKQGSHINPAKWCSKPAASRKAASS